jgi:hypothetical protein
LECSLSDYFHSLLVQNSQLMQIVNDSILATPTSLFLAFPEDLAPPNPPPIRRPGFTHHDRLSSVFLHQARQAHASTVPHPAIAIASGRISFRIRVIPRLISEAGMCSKTRFGKIVLR